MNVAPTELLVLLVLLTPLALVVALLAGWRPLRRGGEGQG